MHELTIAEALLDEVMTLVNDQGFSRVTEIEIAVGEAAPANPAALGRVLTELCAGTSAENAEIRIIPEKLRYFCDDCSHTFPASDADPRCPLCEGDACELIAGRDVMLVNLVGEQERVRVP